jgi:hypothetical protein
MLSQEQPGSRRVGKSMTDSSENTLGGQIVTPRLKGRWAQN